jgi:dipeptidase
LNQYAGKIDVGTIFALLRDHVDGKNTEDLFRSDHHTTASICWHHTEEMPGNTAASLVADLCADGSRLPVYWCSFYSPCLGVFQPLFIEGQIPLMLSIGGSEADAKSPWWLFRNVEAVVRKDTTGDAATAVRATWQRFEAELRITAYEIAAEAKTMIDTGQGVEASRMLTEYMNRNLDRILSTLKGFTSRDFQQ